MCVKYESQWLSLCRWLTQTRWPLPNPPTGVLSFPWHLDSLAGRWHILSAETQTSVHGAHNFLFCCCLFVCCGQPRLKRCFGGRGKCHLSSTIKTSAWTRPTTALCTSSWVKTHRPRFIFVFFFYPRMLFLRNVQMRRYSWWITQLQARENFCAWTAMGGEEKECRGVEFKPSFLTRGARQRAGFIKLLAPDASSVPDKYFIFLNFFCHICPVFNIWRM